MKSICLLLLSTCVFAQGAVHVVDNVNAKYEKNLSPLSLEFKAVNENSFPIDHATQTETRFIGDVIKNLLEGLRDTVINGNDVLPVLDPLEVDHLGPFSVTSTGVKFTGNVCNLRAEGLRWYVVDKVDFNTLRLAFSLHLTQPWLTVTAAYDAEAIMALFVKHNAGGNLKIFLNRLEVGVDLRLGTNILGGGHLTLRELDIKIAIADLKIGIEGLAGSGLLNDLINSLLQNLTQDIIQNKLGEISQTLSEELFDVINEALKDFTLEDILG